MEVIIQKSKKKDKKFDAIVDNKTVSFGAKGYSDYTIHKDAERKQRYINRHKEKENWGISGLKTAGFYAKHILWNKPTLTASINDLNKKCKSIKVKLKT